MTALYILHKGQHINTVDNTILMRRQRKAHVLALSVPSAHSLYSVLWQKVIAPLKIYFLPYINEITHLVFRQT